MAEEPSFPPPALSAEERAEHLKERIYVTFTALAVVVTLRSEPGHVSGGTATSTLFITVLGTLLAVLTADLVSHLVVHAALPTAAEFRQMVGVSLGALSAVVVPLVLVGLAGLGVWSVAAALNASMVALLLALTAVGYLAARRIRLPWWQRLLVLLAEAALGVAVLALELLAHG